MSQPLNDGRLADTGLSNKGRIILGTAAEDLNDTLNFLHPPDYRVKFSGPGGGGQPLQRPGHGPGQGPGPQGQGRADGHQDGQQRARLVRFGQLDHQQAPAVARRTEPAFLLNVTLNQKRQITGVFAGEMMAAHGQGVDFVRETAMRPVPEAFDAVITSNSGYPLDLNLYQAVKGMSAAAQIVRPGGDIIVAAECWDGIPEHGEYANLLRAADSPQALLARLESPGFACMDQWEAHIQALIQLRAEVHIYSDGLSDEQVREALLTPCHKIEDTLAELLARHGPGATLCVLPEGPQTVPYVASANEGDGS